MPLTKKISVTEFLRDNGMIYCSGPGSQIDIDEDDFGLWLKDKGHLNWQLNYMCNGVVQEFSGVNDLDGYFSSESDTDIIKDLNKFLNSK